MGRLRKRDGDQVKPDWLLAIEELEEYAKEQGWPHYAEVGHGQLLRMLLKQAREAAIDPENLISGEPFKAKPSSRIDQWIGEGKCIHYVRGRKLRCMTHRNEEDCPHPPGEQDWRIER